MNTDASASKMTDQSDRNVGAALGIGILLAPYIFVWFLLRRGHSSLSRIIGFLWLGFVILVAIAMPNPEKVASIEKPGEQEKPEVASEPLTERQKNYQIIAQLSEAEIASSCDLAVKSALKSKGSFDTAWSWKFLKDPKSGRVVVLREFEAQNGFGGTISSEYRCLVDAKTKLLIQLAIRQGGDWDIVYNQ